MNDVCPICGESSAKELKVIKILMVLITILFITLLIAAHLLENMA